MSGKSLIALSLILLIGFQLLHKAGFLIYFAFNKAAIIEKSCVNKASKQLKCDGKCHLKKYWAATEAKTADMEKSSNLPQLPKFEKDPTWSCPCTNYIKLPSSLAVPSVLLPSAEKLLEPLFPSAIEICSDIFHPPILRQVV